MAHNTHLNSTVKPSRAAHWSLRLALTGAVLVLFAVFAHRLDLMDFNLAMLGLVGGAVLGLLALLAGFIGIVMTRKPKISGRRFAWVGLILGLIAASPVVTTIYTASNVPPIHDISTDLQNPPIFKAILAVRTDSNNPLDRQNPPNLVALQQAAYPNLTSVLINQNSDQVFNHAHALVTARSWEIVTASASDGHIEATATTPIMRFKDDVVIRIRDEENSSIVDIRSVSRVGKSDLGANAARIEAFLADLKDYKQ